MKRKNLWKRLTAIGAVGVMTLSLAACGSDSKESSGGGSDKVTVTVGLKASHVEISNIEKFKEEWEKKSGNKLDIQAIDDDQFDSLMQTKMSTSGMWDIFIGDTGTQATSYQHEKNLVDLSDEEWAGRLTETGKEFVTHSDGKVYCFPNGGVNSYGIVYNKKVFKDNGLEVPKTYDEFNAVCDKLKGADITPIYVSMGDTWTVNQIMNAEWANILKSNPDCLEKLNKNEMRWDEVPEFVEMFERLKGYVDNGYINSDMSTATYEMGQKAVASGQAAMMYMGDWADPEYIKVEPAGEGNIGIFAAPSKDGDSQLAIAGPGGYYISKQCKNVDAAKDFISFMAEEENLLVNMETRACTSVWEGIDAPNLSGTLEDTQTYIDEGKTQIHYNQTYVITPSDDANSAFLSDLLKQKSPEECAAIWSDAVITVGKQLGFDGFK